MVISKKHKYLFVGLPFSASSTISKELIELYDGYSVLQKHTNVPTFKRLTSIKVKNYLMFGVFRDPIDIVYSKFIKLKFDEKNVYTTPKYFKENGGHVRKKTRDLRKKIISEDWSFEDYIRFLYKNHIPYDNYFTINKKHFSFIIHFRKLNDDFGAALNKCGLVQKRKLPKYNATSSKETGPPRISKELKNQFFGPFLQENETHTSLETEVRPNLLSRVMYRSMKPLRKTKILLDDYRRDHQRDEFFSDLDSDKVFEI